MLDDLEVGFAELVHLRDPSLYPTSIATTSALCPAASVQNLADDLDSQARREEGGIANIEIE